MFCEPWFVMSIAPSRYLDVWTVLSLSITLTDVDSVECTRSGCILHDTFLKGLFQAFSVSIRERAGGGVMFAS